MGGVPTQRGQQFWLFPRHPHRCSKIWGGTIQCHYACDKLIAGQTRHWHYNNEYFIRLFISDNNRNQTAILINWRMQFFCRLRFWPDLLNCCSRDCHLMTSGDRLLFLALWCHSNVVWGADCGLEGGLVGLQSFWAVVFGGSGALISLRTVVHLMKTNFVECLWP